MGPMIPTREDYVAGRLVKFRSSGSRHTVISGRDTLGSNWVINWKKEKVLIVIGTTGLIIDVPVQWKASMSADCIVLTEEHLIIAIIGELDLVDDEDL